MATAYEEAVRYIGNNVHRMDYPRYLAEGWQIGSGSVESACKTVVGQRLNLAGMGAGGRTGRTRSATCGRCSRASPASGPLFGGRSIN